MRAFAQSSKRGYEAIFGENSPERMGSFDHFVSEIAVLNVIVRAAAEIEIYGRMARRQPPRHLTHPKTTAVDRRITFKTVSARPDSGR